jgi:hypothetical protein
MAAIAQAAADAARSARSALPRLRRPTAVLAEELEAGRSPTDRAPTPPSAGVHAETAGVSHARPPATTPPIEGAAAIIARVVGAVRRQHRAWRFSWRLSRCRAWWLSLRVSWRRSWWLWRPSLSRLQRVILALALIDGAIIGSRADLVWAMPQTASFFAALGLPVNLRGVHFDRLAATAERLTASRSSSSKARSAIARQRARMSRFYALQSATRSIRKFIPGPPPQRTNACPLAAGWRFAANLFCRRPTRATSRSGSSIATIVCDSLAQAQSIV